MGLTECGGERDTRTVHDRTDVRVVVLESVDERPVQHRRTQRIGTALGPDDEGGAFVGGLEPIEQSASERRRPGRERDTVGIDEVRHRSLLCRLRDVVPLQAGGP